MKFSSRMFPVLGYTEVGGSTSDILQKVQLDIINNQQCKDVYNDEENYNIYRSQICAGEMAKESSDKRKC